MAALNPSVGADERQSFPKITENRLKLELAAVLAELKRIEAGSSVDEELMNIIELIAIILGGLKGENENGE